MGAGDNDDRGALPAAIARGWPSFLGVFAGAGAAALLTSIPLVLRAPAMNGSSLTLLIVGSLLVAIAISSLGYVLHMLNLLRIAPLGRAGERRLALIGAIVGFLSAGAPLSLLHLWPVGAAGGCALVVMAGAVLSAIVGRALLAASLRSGALQRFDPSEHCGTCGHPIEGLASDRCPECGTLIPESVGAWRTLVRRSRT